MDKLLQALGLREKQQAIFLALLSRGALPATRVAKLCNMARNTTRGILDELAQSGLVARSKRGNMHWYQIEESAGMIRALQAQRESLLQEFGRRIEAVKEHEQLLKDSAHQTQRPKVFFYEGFDGLKKVYEDTLGSNEPLRSWGNFDANQEALPAYFRSYYRRRTARGLRIRSLHPDTPLARTHMRRNKEELRDAKIVPQQYKWIPEIQVYEDKVNVVSWNDRLGLIIQSQEIADAFKSIFDLSFENINVNKKQKRKR